MRGNCLLEVNQGDLYFLFLDLLNVDSLHHHLSLLNRRFDECLSFAQLLDNTGFLEFSFEFLQCALDIFSFFYWDNYHIKLF